MNRPDDDQPEIIAITACPSGWFARYKGDNPDELLVEPVAGWGLLTDTFDGKRVSSVVALVPDGGELVPARDAQNFEEVFFGGSPDEPGKTAGHLVPRILSILASMDGWLERAELDPSYLTATDLAAHRNHLRQISDLLGRQD